ncbi:MAG: type II toxin-antitoxin system PemK/MazF family toxin [Terriglobales bacterium]
MSPTRRGDVWWVAFGPSTGGEIQKTRPAVVVSNNAANAVLNRLVCVPLSRQTSKVYRSEALVRVGTTAAKAMADQIATISVQRLRAQLGAISETDLRAVEDAILRHLAIRR